jgi:dimethylhistidine N-methyltransferase
MNPASGNAALLDLEPKEPEFLSEVVNGLSRRPRTLPCKFFHDQHGAELFQAICELPEYYITRTELKILQEFGPDMASHLGEAIELIGLGTGAGTKTRILLTQLKNPAVYVPVDISSAQLLRSTTLFRQLFPNLEILPVCADYLQPFQLPAPTHHPKRKVFYFPGSTIGNFDPPEAIGFLQRIASLCRPAGGLLIGVDLKKDPAILEKAYNDAQGVTAAFNLNLLARANRELGANFDLHLWQHRAIYDAAAGRIEMHLVSLCDQLVTIRDHQFFFERDEPIITEYSYKHSPEDFENMAASAGFALRKVWTDKQKLFGVFYFDLLP